MLFPEIWKEHKKIKAEEERLDERENEMFSEVTISALTSGHGRSVGHSVLDDKDLDTVRRMQEHGSDGMIGNMSHLLKDGATHLTHDTCHAVHEAAHRLTEGAKLKAKMKPPPGSPDKDNSNTESTGQKAGASHAVHEAAHRLLKCKVSTKLKQQVSVSPDEGRAWRTVNRTLLPKNPPS